MIGFASFAAMGGLAHLWQRVPGVRCNRRALAWSYWLLVIGLGLMVLDLTGAGLVQGSLWQQHLPWIDSVRASQPYWVFRTVDGCLLLAGFVVYGISFFTGERESTDRSGRDRCDASDHHAPSERPAEHVDRHGLWRDLWCGTTVLCGFVSGARRLSRHSCCMSGWCKRHRPAAQLALDSAGEARPGDLWSRRLRLLPHRTGALYPRGRVALWSPTEAWETQGEFPQMWGTRRIGPDLARESGKRPADWQLAHLYNPRYVVPDSMMPGIHVALPGRCDQALAGRLGRGRLSQYLGTSCDAGSDSSYAGAASLMDARSIASMPQAAATTLRKAAPCILANCSGCHGVDGRANSAGGRALRPVAFDLADFRLSARRRFGMRWKTAFPERAMPAWNELPGAEFKAVADYVLSIEQTPDLRPDEQRCSTQTLMLAGQRSSTRTAFVVMARAELETGLKLAYTMPRPANFHQVRHPIREPRM